MSVDLADLFWTIATSNVVILALGIIALAAVLVTHLPLVRFIPTIDDYLRIAGLIGYVALSLFFLFVGHRLADERTETRRLQTELRWSESQLEQQKATADEAARLKDEAEKAAGALQQKVDTYEAELAKRPAGDCALDADDLRRLRDLSR